MTNLQGWQFTRWVEEKRADTIMVQAEFARSGGTMEIAGVEFDRANEKCYATADQLTDQEFLSRNGLTIFDANDALTAQPS